ncbi:MAG: Ig-like domain-containing protein [Candidatus Binatia bacterium]
MRRAQLGLVAGLAVLAASCGGGGGSGGTISTGSPQNVQSPTAVPTLTPPPTPVPVQPTATLTPVPALPTFTPTPLRAVANGTERTIASDAGSLTLRIQTVDLVLTSGRNTTPFTVFINDSRGRPLAGMPVSLAAFAGLSIAVPGTTGTVGAFGETYIDATTGADGSVTGVAAGKTAGKFALSASIKAAAAPYQGLNGLSVTLTIVVYLPPGVTPTQGVGSTVTPGGTTTPAPTPTPLPCQDVKTIIVQTDTPNISSQSGGSAKITAVVFDSNNMRVARVNVLFDDQPRIGTFGELVVATDDQSGTAATTLTIPPGSSFGTLTISASACGISGSVAMNIVSGVSTKPVTTVVLQADPSTVGSLVGGTVNLTAAVFDADNSPINGIDVLFVTPVGHVSPLTDRTTVTGSQNGIATSVLQIPAGTPEGKLVITALAGGVSGGTIITVVPGRVPPGTINPGVPPGEPAGISLGASPTRIQVSGTGGTELATVIGRVFDNNGNPLSGVRVHYHVVTGQSAPGSVILAVTTPAPTASPTPVPETLCQPEDPVAVSDVAGFAVIQVHSGPQPGPVTVAACADTTVFGVPSPIREQSTIVTVTSGPVSRLNVAINNVASDNNDGTLLTMVSAIVTDAQGNPVQDGTAVFFEVLPLDAADPARNVALVGSAITNGSPACDTTQFQEQTGIPISPQPGDAISCLKYPIYLQGMEIRVRASVAGVVNSVNGQALTLPGFIGDLEATVIPSTITVSASASGLAKVQVVALDRNFDPLRNVRVRFTTTVGTIDRSVLTDQDGVANATLTIPAGTAAGAATVRVSGGGLLIPMAVPIINTGGTVSPPTQTPGPGGPQPGAMHFVGAQPDTIGVRGSGLPEQSILTFQVTDVLGSPLAGVPVNFSIAQVSNEQVSPAQGVSDGNGQVRATLTSGQRALSIQVTAQITAVSPAITTRSTAVNVLGGPPSQPNFSLARQFNNISGRVTFGLQNRITAFVADRFGNPVPPGTAVNFTTKAGAIGNQTATDSLGQATATLVSQEPVPDSGIVVSLATTVGERPFVDVNGNGICDAPDTLLPIAEPYYDADCNGAYDAGEDFIDLNDNGTFDTDQGSGTQSCTDQVTIFESTCTTFSGQTSAVLVPSGSGAVAAGGAREFVLWVSDNPNMIGFGVGNPIVGGSTVSLAVVGGRAKINGLSTFTLPDAQTLNQVNEINKFPFTVTDGNPTAATAQTDTIVATITSAPGSLPAGGNGSLTIQSGITFLAAPTPTPAATATFTPSPTATPVASPTPTPLPPSVAPLQAFLAAGSGAPPIGCNGATQTFVVTGGSPPFTVFPGGGCISTNSVPASGGSFVFTAGSTLGNFTITVTDAAGKTASAGVTIQGPATPTVTFTPPLGATFTVTPTATATPPPGSIQFLGATPAAIGVRGSGLPEQAVLTFRVRNVTGGPIPGVTVQFTLSGTGSESLNPLTAVSDPDGVVQTAVTSGVQATSVRVTASVQSLPGVSAQSTAVSILGAPPAMNHFSIAAAKLNIPGRVTYGLEDQISAFVNDRFGNAVPPGTAVSFITNAASVVSPTTTNAAGVATATLLSEGVVPPSGIVTVLAYTHGEESFLDNNGNGIFDTGDAILTDDVAEPFIDFRPPPADLLLPPPNDGACTVPAPSPACNNRFDPNTPFEFFTDTNATAVWDSISTTGSGQGQHGVWDHNILVFDTVPITFSGPTQAPVLEACQPGPCSGFHLLPGQSMAFTIDVHDDLRNPLTGGSTISVTTSGGKIDGGNISVPDGESFNRLVPGLTQFTFVLSVDATVDKTTPANITVTIASPNGNVTTVLTSGVVGP